MGSLAAKTILRAYGWWLTIRCKMGSSRSSRTQPMLEVPGRPKYVGKGSFVSGAWAAAQGRDETTGRRQYDAFSLPDGHLVAAAQV